MKRVLLGFFALLFSTCAAYAVTLQFDIIESRWDNAVSGTVLNIDDTFAGGTQSVDWGDACDFGANLCSGYDFTSAGSVVLTENAPFILGDFQHRNNPIQQGSEIDTVDLFIRGNILIDTGSGFQNFGDRTFAFQFDHNETRNNADPCPAPIGNENGCSDIATVSLLEVSETLQVNDQLLTLSVEGFRQAGIFTQQFISPEGGNTQAEVIASFGVSTVPIPAPVVLLISALIGLGFLGRRKAP